MAVNQGDEDAAIKLFKGASLLNPSNSLPKVGLGYMHLCKLELKPACKLFEEVLAEEPANDMAKAFLGIALSFTPNEVSQGEAKLAEVRKNSKDENVRTLANTAIDFVEQFVKKMPSPAAVQPPKNKS